MSEQVEQQEVVQDVGMSLAQWRRSNLKSFVTGSGLRVTVDMRISMMELAAVGTIPATLLSKWQDMAKRAARGEDGGSQMEEIQQSMQAVDTLVAAALTNPKVVPDDQPTTDETIHIGELPFEDRLDIFNKVNGRVMRLAPFRGEQSESGDSGQAGAAV